MPAIGTGRGSRPAHVKQQRNKRKRPTPTPPPAVFHSPEPAYVPPKSPTRGMGLARDEKAKAIVRRQTKRRKRHRAWEREKARNLPFWTSGAGFGAASDLQVEIDKADRKLLRTARRGFGTAADYDRRVGARIDRGRVVGVLADALERQTQRRGFGALGDYARQHPAAYDPRKRLVSEYDVLKGKRPAEGNLYTAPLSKTKNLTPEQAAALLMHPLDRSDAKRQQYAGLIGAGGLGQLKSILKSRKSRRASHYAKVAAPAVAAYKVVDSLRRANAAAEQQALRGSLGGVGAATDPEVYKAWVEGLTGKREVYGADIVKQLGIENPIARGALGALLDIRQDPMMFVGAGPGRAAIRAGESVLGRSAAKAARSTGKAAMRAEARQVRKDLYERGSSRLQARRLVRAGAQRGRILEAGGRGARAGRLAEREAGEKGSRGVRVTFAGLPIPGVTPVSAAVGRSVKAGARKAERSVPGARLVPIRGLGRTARALAAGANATVRGNDMTPEEFAFARAVDRKRRATEETITRQYQQRATAMSYLLKGDDWKLIRRAIERDDVDSLKGIAEPVRLPLKIRGVPTNRAARRLAQDPDRLHTIATQLPKDWAATRGRLVETGRNVGYRGAKPLVDVPDVAPAKEAVKEARKGAEKAERARRKAEKRAVTPLPSTPDAAAEQLRQRYQGVRDKVTGLRYGNVTAGRFGEDRLHVGADIIDRNGEKVGRVSRFYDPNTGAIIKETTRLDEPFQRRGIGTRLAQAEERALQSTGVRRVETVPVTEAGQKLTARLGGFKEVGPEAPGRVAKKLKRPRSAPAREAEAEAKRLLQAARTERDSVAQAARDAEALNAIRAMEAQGYVPRTFGEATRERARIADLHELLAEPFGRRGARAESTLERKALAPIDEIEAQARIPGEEGEWARKYMDALVESGPLIHAAYGHGMARAIALAESKQALIDAGRPLASGAPREHEAIYRRFDKPTGADGTVPKDRQMDLVELGAGDTDELIAVQAGKLPADDYLILNKSMHDRAMQSLDRVKGGDKDLLGTAFDRLWGKWRTVALATLAYPLRNQYSDVWSMYLGRERGEKTARNYFKHAPKTLREARKREKAYKWFESEMEKSGKGGSVNVNGVDVPYRVLAAEFDAYAGSGRVQEIYEQRGMGSTGVREGRRGVTPGQRKGTKGTVRAKSPTPFRRLVEAWELRPRMSTYIGARQRGLSPEEAAARVADIHFDYGELTNFERNARRLMPFYTFTARNIPRQAKLLATRPGRATIPEKIRQNAQTALEDDIPPNVLAQLSPYEARQLGIPIRWGTDEQGRPKIYHLSMGGPWVDLNDVVPHDFTDPAAYGQVPVRLGLRGLQMLGPWKVIIEQLADYSFFYRDTITNQNKPLTPAPLPVRLLAEASSDMRQLLGARKIKDPRSGKTVWGWPRRYDYAAKSMLPGLTGAAYRAGQDTTSRGYNLKEELIGLSGLRATPLDREEGRKQLLYKQLDDLNDEIDTLEQSLEANALSDREAVRLVRLKAQKKVKQGEIKAIDAGALVNKRGTGLRRVRGGGGLDLDGLDLDLSGVDDLDLGGTDELDLSGVELVLP